jgi:UDP-N-acetylglucosamine 3-dehydrogenase
MSLRAGLVGLGMMGRHHARVLREVEGVDLVAIADPGGDRHCASGDLPLLGSAEEVLAAGIDLAVVAVPTASHEEVAIAFADAGVHVMVEKPLASTADAARRIAQAFESRGLVGCVGQIERYNAALQQLRRRLEQGELGEVYQIATRRQGPFPSRIADVGVIKDLATHDIDLTAWVAQHDYLTISAHTAHRSGREHEDLVAAVGLLEGGTVTSHLVNWLSPFKERVTVVTGERGAFVADTLTVDLSYHANGSVASEWESLASFRGVTEGDVVRYAFPKAEPLRTELEAFRDAILGDPSRVVAMSEGVRTVAVAEAALASAERGGLVVSLA